MVTNPTISWFQTATVVSSVAFYPVVFQFLPMFSQRFRKVNLCYLQAPKGQLRCSLLQLAQAEVVFGKAGKAGKELESRGLISESTERAWVLPATCSMRLGFTIWPLNGGFPFFTQSLV